RSASEDRGRGAVRATSLRLGRGPRWRSGWCAVLSCRGNNCLYGVTGSSSPQGSSWGGALGPLPQARLVGLGAKAANRLERLRARGQHADPVHLAVDRVRHDAVEGRVIVLAPVPRRRRRAEQGAEGLLADPDIQSEHARPAKVRCLVVLVTGDEGGKRELL